MESLVDSNNNASGGKYSLRPRNGAKRPQESPDEEDVFTTCRRAKKTTPRGLSLSKYRRKSANARERTRMREINAAFEALRRVVGWQSEGQGEKATKISTLRLAMRHITALSEALQETSTSSGESHQSGLSDGIFDDSDLSVGEFVIQESSVKVSAPLNSSKTPKISTISSLSFYNTPSNFSGGSSEFESAVTTTADGSSFAEGSSSLVYTFPTLIPSAISGLRVGTQCDTFCDKQHSDSRSDSEVPGFRSVHLTSTRPSFGSSHVTSLDHPTPGVSSLPETLPAPPPTVNDCSSLLSPDIEAHSLQPISFEELFIT